MFAWATDSAAACAFTIVSAHVVALCVLCCFFFMLSVFGRPLLKGELIALLCCLLRHCWLRRPIPPSSASHFLGAGVFPCHLQQRDPHGRHGALRVQARRFTAHSRSRGHGAGFCMFACLCQCSEAERMQHDKQSVQHVMVGPGRRASMSRHARCSMPRRQR